MIIGALEQIQICCEYLFCYNKILQEGSTWDTTSISTLNTLSPYFTSILRCLPSIDKGETQPKNVRSVVQCQPIAE